MHKPIIRTQSRVSDIIARREFGKIPKEHDILHGIITAPVGVGTTEGHGDMLVCDFETPEGIKAKTLMVVNGILGSIVTGSLYIDENSEEGTVMLPRVRLQLPIKAFGRRKIDVGILDNSIESQEYVDSFAGRI